MRLRIHCCWSCGLLLLAATGCSTLRGPRLTPEQKALNLESFEVVWETVRDKHYDENLNGLDWEAIREEYRPRVMQAAEMDEARSAMREMLGRLGQSHFGIIPASAYESIDGDDPAAATDEGDAAEKQDAHGYAGLDVRVLDGKAIITDVAGGYPGEEQGVKTGWELVSVNGRRSDESIELVTNEYADSTLLDLVSARVISRQLSGDVGDTVALVLRDGEGDEVENELTLVSEPGQRTHVMGIPERVVRLEHRRLAGDIGYIRFNGFWDPNYLMAEFGTAMKSFMDADGVIIDVRGNPGGIGALSMGMAGWLIGEKNLRLGTMYLRNQELNFVVFPRARTYHGPVAILIDGLSVSTSEIFAGGLQDLGRARIFGTRTAGAALPSIVDRLPNADGFQYVFANYISRGGKALEGAGVTPDEHVALTRDSLLAGEDRVIGAAVAWIQANPTGTR